MAETIYDADGNEVEVFVRSSGGMVDALVRANTEADWLIGAVFYGLLIESEQDLVPAPGVEISPIGPAVIELGSYSTEGEEIVPPVVDQRFHVNLRIHGPALERVVEGTDFPKWKQMAINWTRLGEEDVSVNSEERAVVLGNVALIDPDSVKSQSRVWL